MRLSDQGEVARSRVRFLTAETESPDAVRDPILASWQRSQDFQVAADRIQLPYFGDPEPDTPFGRNAAPVLRSLSEQLKGQSISVILTDHSGVVLSRLTGDSELERHLDGVLLAPGFSYSEEYVGTNGIGTALEMGGPAHVFGHEHYAENLEDLACAGVPIHHPVSGRLVGAVDLTCWHKDAGALLLTLARTTAEQIRQALLADTGAHQIALFHEYLRTCHHRTDAVFALSEDLVMLNDHARSVLDPVDQATMLARATEAISSLAPGHDASYVVELASGRSVRLHCRSVGLGDRTDGVVAHLALEPAEPQRTRPPESRMPLPGLVGTAPPWQHACEEVERTIRAGEWVALEGEAGVGKMALLRAVQLRRRPVGRLAVFDAARSRSEPDWLAAVRRAATTEADVLVLQHVDTLDAEALRGVRAALRSATAARGEGHSPLWVAVTMREVHEGKELQDLLRLFPTTVVVPPLRLHLEDLQLLVPFFLARLGRGGNLVCSHEAMRLLMRMSWPGNIGQVHGTLREIVRHRRTGSIAPEDLPPEAHTTSRRVLTSLESLERDAIVRSLAAAHGNKARAAQALGMSRATIYRKIHDFGIIAPST